MFQAGFLGMSRVLIGKYPFGGLLMKTNISSVQLVVSSFIDPYIFIDCCSCSVVSDSVTPWSAAHQVSLYYIILHYLLEFAQTHLHWISNAIQPSHPLSSPSPPAFNLSQHQALFQWVSSLHQVAKVLEFQLQHQSFQWIFRPDFL